MGRIDTRIDVVFALGSEQMWLLTWQMTHQIVPPLGDGGPPAAAIVTAAGTGDTATLTTLVIDLHAAENSPLTRNARR
ncbi:hypothetical protein [Amycolatopsis sp. CA-230715]|uniref:hypothetical protein n=1 Tax=Amycolatopsis sp. CA-230715 TaxID=2745196 RepID=UPI001C015791|nr:hypothetical protein [Amycolatopsis sp. CA-230715]QWF85871.1 hypothetical protein HUW46_09351 [Amycolatopsis sp. CA-230715]